MKKTSDIFRGPSGFSLAEVLAALTIGTLVLVAVLSIYSAAENSAAAVTRNLDNNRRPAEVLQRIAEDLDRMIMSGPITEFRINNKLDSGYQIAQLSFKKTITDSRGRPQVFEEVTWQAKYFYDVNSVVLYRSHAGMVLEDKLLDEGKENWERELFVPICEGLTFFKIEVLQGENVLDTWMKPTSVPDGVIVTLSFAPPFKNLSGTLDVLDTQKVTRTIATNRTKKHRFVIEKKKSEEEEELQE